MQGSGEESCSPFLHFAKSRIEFELSKNLKVLRVQLCPFEDYLLDRELQV